MQKAFEKIVERLEERTAYFSDCTKYGNKDEEQEEKSYSTMFMYEVADLVEDLIEIVKEVAEEYKSNDGWIPCEEKLPGENGLYLVTIKNLTGRIVKRTNVFVCEYMYGEFIFDGWTDNDVTAWQPLPQPYVKENK